MKRRNAQKGLTTSHNGLVYKNPNSHMQTAQPQSPNAGDGRLQKQGTFLGPGALKVGEKVRGASVTEEGPKPRDGHVALNVGNNMFVFGGDRHQVPFNDLFFLPLGEL